MPNPLPPGGFFNTLLDGLDFQKPGPHNVPSYTKYAARQEEHVEDGR
jgi:hypothetical protein